MNKSTKKIMDRIAKGNFSLSANPVYSHNPAKLAADEYTRCKSFFERKSHLVKADTLFKYEKGIIALMGSIARKEIRNYDVLKRLASDLITELYNVPSRLNLSPEFNLDLNMKDAAVTHPEITISEERKLELQDEIQKRLLLNGLVHGSSIHIWKTVYYLAKPKIDAIDGGLFELYEKYASSIGMYAWIYFDIESILKSLNAQKTSDEVLEMLTQGYESLEFNQEENEDDELSGEETCTVHARAINFPVLLHELNKGVMDYLILKGINKDLDEEELAYVFQEADKLEHELWHQYLSPSIWKKLIDKWNVDTTELPKLISGLSLMSYEELKNYLIEIQDEKQ